MTNDIETQLMNALKYGGDIEGVYEGSDDIPQIPSRELTPLEVEQISSEFRKKIEDGEEGLPDDIIADYLHTRDFLYTLLNQASMALGGAMGLARDTDQPRAYQVVRELLETSRELSKDIMSLQKTYKEIKKIENSGSPSGTEGTGAKGTSTTTSSLLEALEALEKSES